jgi:hypothetical protein
MSTSTESISKKITAYQLLGWTPLLLTIIGATTVVVLSVISDL